MANENYGIADFCCGQCPACLPGTVPAKVTLTLGGVTGACGWCPLYETEECEGCASYFNGGAFELFNDAVFYSKFNEGGYNVGTYPVIAQWQDGELCAVFPLNEAGKSVLDPDTLEPLN